MPHRVVDPELVKEVVNNHPVRIERGARVKALRLPPGEKLLYVLGRDKPGVGFGCRTFGEEFEYVFVLLVSEGLTERLDVFEERFDGFLKREGLVFIAAPESSRPLSLAPSSRRLRFWASNASAAV
jgi:hypothetical protein